MDGIAIYRPEEWQNFFVTVGSGSAALTGLVVVAISAHLRVIMRDVALRHRSRMVLAGLSGAFLRSSLVLMGGQGARAVAVELFAVCTVLNVMGLLSYAPVTRGSGRNRAMFLRTIGGFVCYTTEMLGAALLFDGKPWGLNIAAVSMVINFYFMISGSWLLLVGIREDEAERAH